jgi:hypothetical protein
MICAAITEKADAYEVAIFLREHGQAKQLIATTVLSQDEAEAIARAYAYEYNVGWSRV